MTTTFKVSDVNTNSVDNIDKYSYSDFDRNIESYEINNVDLIIAQHNQIANSFVKSIHEAFDAHRNLVLSPDDIWIVLAQGFAEHINQNAEKYRSRFVSFDGKKEIVVERNNFILGRKDNDWKSVYNEFSDRIKDEIGNTRELLVSNFSTTGPVEKAVSEIVLMDTMKSFFSYKVLTMCGIPTITLLGTTEDWQNIKNRFSMFSEYDLEWWVNPVLDILDEFIKASKNNVNTVFWQSMYKYHSGSGGDSISGWIGSLFPYLMSTHYSTGAISMYKNKYVAELGDMSKFKYGGISQSDLPNGLSIVPFIWDYYEKRFDMEFCAGFVGVAKDTEHNAIRPSMGWAIRQKETETKKIREKLSMLWKI